MLELRNVSKYYFTGSQVVQALRRVSFVVNVGELLCITGASGSGKTTLLNIIGGLDTYEEGALFVDGKDFSHYTTSEMERYRREHIGFVIQASGDPINMAPDRQIGFPITGIADNGSQSVWMAEELIYSFITPSLIDYRILGESFQIIQGDYPTTETYILLNEQYPALVQGDIPQSVGLGTGSYYISGIYRYAPEGSSHNASKLMVSTLEFIRTRFFRFENGVKNDYEIMIYATDVELALANLIEAGYRVVDHRYDLELARRMKFFEYANLYVLGLAGLVLCALSVFVIVRSQLIERRYEIGVYRGIGISRREVLRIFLFEALVVAAVSSVAAFLLTVGLMEWAASSFSRLSITQYSVVTIALGIVGLLAVHVLFSLLPVAALLRKTPAELMKQSDL